ncbi:GNAT family N-acetyltransferase [Pseudomonas sp. NPDC077382]
MIKASSGFRIVLGSSLAAPDEATSKLVSTARGSLKPVLGDRRQRHRLLASAIHWDRVLLAYDGTVPVGFAMFKHAGRGPFSPSLSAFRREYGQLGGLWRYAVYVAGEWREGRHGFFLYSLKVINKARNLGIASALLDATERHARNCGYSQVELEVFSSNARARQLYEKRGYQVLRRIDLGPVARLFVTDSALYRMSSGVLSQP